jgi:hypothetical protein
MKTVRKLIALAIWALKWVKPEIGLELPLFPWRALVQLSELGPPALPAKRLPGSAHPSAARHALPGFGAVINLFLVEMRA